MARAPVVISRLSRQLNYRIVWRERRVIPGVIKRSVIAEWTIPLRSAIGLQHQVPDLYPGKIVSSESVGHGFEGTVLCRQEAAPTITAVSFAPRFNHAFLRADSDRVATDFITSALFNQKNFIEGHSEGFGNEGVGAICVERVLIFAVTRHARRHRVAVAHMRTGTLSPSAKN